MLEMSSTGTGDELHPFNLYHKTSNSSSSSVVTVQRAASVGPSRSNIRQSATFLESSDTAAFDPNNAAYFSKPVGSPESKRNLHSSHSRSSSHVGTVKEGLANLNRWSQSTTSSKGSGAFSRRMSFGNTGPSSTDLLDPSSPPNVKHERPAVDNPTRLAPSGRPFDSTSNPVLSLPPLVTLNALHPSNEGTTPLSASTPTPSTGTLLSAAVHATVPDYFGATWEEPNSREEGQARAFGQSRNFSEPAHTPGGSLGKLPENLSPSRNQRRDERHHSERGHSRNRSHAGKGSSGTTSSEKSREKKGPSQKAMLSKALEKANTAVLLDNAQNFEGAIEAYAEACNLLQQVMLRSSGDDDRRKLEAIRNTYTSRILELEKITPYAMDDGKALPARPESVGYQSTIGSQDDEDATIETARIAMIVDEESYVSEPRSRQIAASQVPMRRESLMSSSYKISSNTTSLKPPELYIQSEGSGKYPLRERVVEINSLAPPMSSEYMPPPLSPRRPPPKDTTTTTTTTLEHSSKPVENEYDSNRLDTAPAVVGHARVPSNESMSWLDTIDESGGSTASSVHSRTSSLGVRRKHIRAASGATEAEFDAALDAAVEAAYDDGFEPVEERYEPPSMEGYDDDLLLSVRRKVEMAREMVRQTERETAIQTARERERMRMLQEKHDPRQSFIADYDDDESEEEERLLEEMTKGYVMDDFEFGLQNKSTVPRESDSSGFSGRTWNSSIGSNPTTAGTTLSTVPEKTFQSDNILSSLSKTQAGAYGPPPLTLPPPPTSSTSHSRGLSDGLSISETQSVRSRRLSGQNPKQLKIETVRKPSIGLSGPLTEPPSMPPPPAPVPPASDITSSSPTTSTVPLARQPMAPPARPPVPQSTRQASSPLPGPTPSEFASPPTPNLTGSVAQGSEEVPRSGSPGRAQSRTGIRKNFSSTSLRNLKNRNLSVSHIDDVSDLSPNTPISHGSDRLPAIPVLPTPIAMSFRDRLNSTDVPTGGFHLFSSAINSPDSPGASNEFGDTAPIPLEPCPTEYLLRPFWLMRALYQTLAHPAGGYLSTKLFIPKDVWRVKGVKIKAIEDKISNCDYLTAALQKLAKVDTYDADQVLDEMQALESILEQVQAALSKKLGNDVGVSGSGVLFKDAPVGGDVEIGTAASSSRTSGSGGKSTFSWRRLRSKNSGMGLTNSYTTKVQPSVDALKDGLTMSSLPMTSLANIRFAKRDVGAAQFSGPNANYMAALARLFDAAQVIDQVARQVEDPGLRHADKTQVGLELCTRHAAEFFGFYICRFVLADVSLLLDKFIKRGSEWVVV